VLYKAINFVSEQLQCYFNGLENENVLTPPAKVVLENIGTFEDKTSEKEDNCVVMTLVNLTEEATLKNIPSFLKENDTISYKNPPVFINVYVLFVARMQKYHQSLLYLSQIIKYFQGKSVFTAQNIPDTNSKLDSSSEFRIIMELQSLSFEQVNYLWSTLGGKQHPFVCYKIRLLQIERDSTKETRGIITDIQIEER
jgi:hypothetical protein